MKMRDITNQLRRKVERVEGRVEAPPATADVFLDIDHLIARYGAAREHRRRTGKWPADMAEDECRRLEEIDRDTARLEYFGREGRWPPEMTPEEVTRLRLFI